jgi:hypothetical protein
MRARDLDVVRAVEHAARIPSEGALEIVVQRVAVEERSRADEY